MDARRSVLTSAKLIAVCTLISRVGGMVRDMLLASMFGVSWVADAFTYAFQFPNLFRRLFGEGSLAPVFVPTFTRTLQTDGREAAWRLLGSTFKLMTVALLVVLIGIEVILAIVWLIPVKPENAEARRLLLALTGIMMPFMLTVCLLALFSSILNCLGSFGPAALAPVILNIGMILGMTVVAPLIAPGKDEAARERQAFVVAWTVVVSGVLQLACIWPALRRHGVPIRWAPAAGDPAVGRMLKLLPPVALGQGVLAFGVFLDSQLCVLLEHKHDAAAVANYLGFEVGLPLTEGALAALGYAQRLYQFPLGVLAISLATAALPTFSAHAARGDWAAWAAEMRRTVRFAVFEGILAGAMMVVLAEPIVRLLFQYRNFDAVATQRTAAIVAWYALGMWAFCAQHMILRGFYSVENVRTPLVISVAVLPLNVLITLSLVWVAGIREAAFAIASVTTASVAVIVGMIVLQQRQNCRVVDRETVAALVKMLVAAGLACGAIYLGHRYWPVGEPVRLSARVAWRAAETFGFLGAGAGLFLGISHLLGLGEARALISMRKRRAARVG